VSPPLPQPSSRFIRAARSEQDGVRRHRDQLLSKRDSLLAEIRRLDEALADIDQRLLMLGELLGTPGVAASNVRDSEKTDTGAAEAGATASDRTAIRGPAIREVAVRVLLDQPEYIEALHYRRWYELVVDAGNAIAGKDPLAVFLTQITRSPVVRKGTQSGDYDLDRQAPLRLRQRLERLRAELRELTNASVSDSEIASSRARRHDLDVAISQQERALEEALRVLRRDGEEASVPAVTAARA
jgi:hypothetical protein